MGMDTHAHATRYLGPSTHTQQHPAYTYMGTQAAVYIINNTDTGPSTEWILMDYRGAWNTCPCCCFGAAGCYYMQGGHHNASG